MGTWATLAVRRGFVVLLIDSLGPRDVDTVCLGPKKGVNFARGVRDALQAADYLRTFDFVDKRRVAQVGFSWGAMVALLSNNNAWRSALPGAQGFTAAVSLYPVCLTNGPPFDFVQKDTDRPTLVLLGDKDVEGPSDECVTRLQSVKQAGAPIEWHVFHNATHCWDCEHLNGTTRRDSRGTNVTYRFNRDLTEETQRRVFEFLERSWKSTGN
jgi:dienelactone hydrolase